MQNYRSGYFLVSQGTSMIQNTSFPVIQTPPGCEAHYFTLKNNLFYGKLYRKACQDDVSQLMTPNHLPVFSIAQIKKPQHSPLRLLFRLRRSKSFSTARCACFFDPHIRKSILRDWSGHLSDAILCTDKKVPDGRTGKLGDRASAGWQRAGRDQYGKTICGRMPA